MSLSTSSTRPLACLKQALRQCRAERQQHRQYAVVPAATESAYPSLQTRYPLPTPGFRTSQTTKQNRTLPNNLTKHHNQLIYLTIQAPKTPL